MREGLPSFSLTERDQKPRSLPQTLSARSKESGQDPTQYSAYSLRHAFAMRLLKRGVGIKAIGDVLGHRDLESTCVYLRLDIDALRDVALEVPAPNGANGGGCHA